MRRAYRLLAEPVRPRVRCRNRDGVIQNGSCYAVPSGEKTDISACAAGAEAAKKELDVSDTVVEYNLIPKLRN